MLFRSQAFAALFAERGVESGGIQWTSRRPSRVVLVRRDGSGESGFGGFLGDRGLGFADQDLDAEALYRAVLPWLAQADWLLCGTLALASPGSAAALDRLLALLPAPAAPPGKAAAGRPSLAVDVNWRPTFWDPSADPASGPGPGAIAAIQPLLQQAALLKCAREEAEWLFGTEIGRAHV